MTSLECMTYIADCNVYFKCGKLLVAVCVRCVKNRISHNFKPQHVVSLCMVLVT